MTSPLQSFIYGNQAGQQSVINQNTINQQRAMAPIQQGQAENKLKQSEMDIATQRGQLLLNTLNAIEKATADPGQRLQIAQKALPELQKLGINFGDDQITIDDFTDEGIARNRAELTGLVQPPQKDDRTGAIKEYEYGVQNPGFAQRQIDLKTAGASKTNIDNTINSGQEKFFDELGKVSAKKLVEQREDILQMIPSLEGIRKTRDLLDKGVITGTGAKFRVALGKALNTAGINYAADEVANSEAFVASQAKQVANIITAFGAGTGLSDADREFAIKAAGGDITMTESAIRRILDINERAIRNSAEIYNKEASQVPENIVPYSLTVDLPEQPSGKQSNNKTIKWSDL